MHSTSMHRHAEFNTAHGLPYKHRIDAGYVFVRRFIKGFVSQAHGLVKKMFMVHRQIIYGLGLIGHSYFPRGS